jgi:hypothetical protein
MARVTKKCVLSLAVVDDEPAHGFAKKKNRDYQFYASLCEGDVCDGIFA